MSKTNSLWINAEVYPKSAKFEQWFEKELKSTSNSFVMDLYQVCLDNIQGYEHGEADVIDVLPEVHELLENGDDDVADDTCLNAYVRVCEDLVLTAHSLQWSK